MADTTKTTSAKVTLPKDIFGVEVKNHELLKLAYDAFLANSRSAQAKTKKRGEVSGGGKKPWRQKGTGRARFGSSRNPIWRGGGIAFGPTGTENYTKKLPTSSKRIAIKQALTLANKAKKVSILDFKTTGKTSEIVKQLADKKMDRKVLIVVDKKTPEIMRATNNLQNVLLVSAKYLSVYYILNADHIAISTKSVAIINDWLGKSLSKKEA